MCVLSLGFGLCLFVMDTRGRLVAGSHNRNEFILINADEASRVRVFPEPSFLLFFYVCWFCGVPIF